MSLLDVLKHYSNPNAAPAADVDRDFDVVSQQVDPQDLSSGVAAAMRSDATPSFGETISNLFAKSDPNQKAGALNEILRVLGPRKGSILDRILQAAGNHASSAPITPAQATQVSPADLRNIAAEAEKENDSIVDRLAGYYAQHPTLVKTLGVAALGAAMSHMNRQRRM
jgi:hypothetical protein